MEPGGGWALLPKNKGWDERKRPQAAPGQVGMELRNNSCPRGCSALELPRAGLEPPSLGVFRRQVRMWLLVPWLSGGFGSAGGCLDWMSLKLIPTLVHCRLPGTIPHPPQLLLSRWDLSLQEMPSVSVLDYALPQRPPQPRDDERDPSERALPRRSSSPVIGSPPVHAVPIGTPPKQAAVPSFNQQILCPKPVHIRATLQQRYPAPYGERMSPNQLCNVPNSSLLGHPFPHSVSPVLTHLQRAQLLGGAQAGRMSPSQFARVSGLVGSPIPSVNPKLLQGRVGQMMPPASGFRAFFGAPPAPPPSQLQHPPGPHLQGLRPQAQMFRPDTTHLHPQHRRLLHQRQQQSRSQHRSLNGSVGDRGGHRSSHQEQMRKDPYANLMLQREKDWVSKIQMMQLQSTDPYLDDYYYQNYFQKLEKLSAAEEVHGDGPKKERTKLITPQVAKLEHTYKPVQFEGSLGKLTVSSVNNPRKMIDAVVTSRSEDDETKEKQVRDKRRQTLVTIEKTYSLLLDVEDYERRYLLSLEGERPALMGERKQKICDMYDNLRGKAPGQDRPSDDHFMQIMCIRKGKRLVARILPFLSPEQAADVLMATARNLPFLIKKDAQDEVLPCLLRPFSHVLYHLPLGTVTSLVQQLTNLPQSAPAPAPTNLHLTAVLQNKVLPPPLPAGQEEASRPSRSNSWEFPSAGCSHGAGMDPGSCRLLAPGVLCFPCEGMRVSGSWAAAQEGCGADG
uniref:Protein PAT1 homolog 1 n=1 Tax=Amazona collaria TaxID=241587 RepID=A0A8B9IZZ2_9PSIT